MYNWYKMFVLKFKCLTVTAHNIVANQKISYKENLPANKEATEQMFPCG